MLNRSLQLEEANIHITLPNSKTRDIDWFELNQLKKDILWIYDENYGDIQNAFAPSYSFPNKYWEYLTLDGPKSFYESDRLFYESGVLIILLCFCIEYNSTESGDQNVFNRIEFDTITKYVSDYAPRNQGLLKLKNKVLLGLEIAKAIPDSELLNTEYEIPRIDEFYDGLNIIGNKIIQDYYSTRTEKI